MLIHSPCCYRFPGAGAQPARPKPWSRTASSPVQCPSDRGSRSFQSCRRAGGRMACRPCERKQSRVIDEVIEDTKPAARMKPTVPNRDKALRINGDPRTARPPLVRKQGGAGGTAGPAASAAHAGCRLGWIKSLGRIQPGIDLRRFPEVKNVLTRRGSRSHSPRCAGRRRRAASRRAPRLARQRRGCPPLRAAHRRRRSHHQ